MNQLVTRSFPLAAGVLLITVLLGGCGKKIASPKSDESRSEANGVVVFTANGEDFVRQGFVDRRGWHISFDNLFVNIVDPTAYTASGDGVEVVLKGAHWVDLATGDENADPITLGRVKGVPAANYQSLRFFLKRATSGEYRGYAIVMMGRARKNTKTVDFVIKLDEEMDFDGREGFVGDEIKGLLKPGGETTVEMTFHFDHVFGDSEASAKDHVNTGSVGFDFFYSYADGSSLDVSQSAMKDSDGYGSLMRALWSLGHLGEGHCDVSNQSSKGTFETQ